MLTKEEAVKKSQSKWWLDKTDEEIAEFQIHESRLCCPFEVFHKAVETWLGRPVWTHEFADPKLLIAEKESTKQATFTDVIGKLAKYKKPVIIVTT
jgi:hypothetical protein